MSEPIRSVVVTGSEGYIGALLTPTLWRYGYKVMGIDACWFTRHAFQRETCPARLRRMDIRDVEIDDLRGADAVIHLAALSSDAVADLDPDLTRDINHHATVRLGEVAKDAGVRRFVFASSCSVYGRSEDAVVDETTPLRPRTAYARSKVDAERDLLALSADGFAVACLRNATAHGISPRQRFDLVLPDLTASAWVHNRIRLTSDGSPWRPLVHVRDINRAAVACLTAPADRMAGRCFNVGTVGGNYQVRDLANAIRRRMPSCEIAFEPAAGPDPQSYRVSFESIQRELPGFTPTWDLDAGITEAFQTYARIDLDQDAYENPVYTRATELKRLVASGWLGADLRRPDRELTPA